MVLHVSSDLNEGLLGHDTGVSLDSGKEQDVCRYHPRVDSDGYGTEGYNQQTHWERAGEVIEADCEVRGFRYTASAQDRPAGECEGGKV
ncbi:MAG: hypothetical protein KDN22_02205 [Verrucomicrobiae bacterium]|nr:hypothetical protein [Verrucomicrobiae bacterium]